MSTHETLRLEASDGTVIAYLAPEFEVNETTDNDLKGSPRPRGEPSIVRDQQLITMELTVQGQFEHSENLPTAHANALELLFGQTPVTARDQVDRIRRFAVDRSLESNGVTATPLHFYDGPDEYAYTTAATIDWQAGRFPPVSVTEFSPSDEPGASRFEYTLKLAVGTPEGVVL